MMNLIDATRAYERWMGVELDLARDDLALKHKLMATAGAMCGAAIADWKTWKSAALGLADGRRGRVASQAPMSERRANRRSLSRPSERAT
jgi:hypothetical protein